MNKQMHIRESDFPGKLPKSDMKVNNKNLITDFQFTGLGMFMLYRFLNNRDFKIIITSSGSTTGTGKTTLAIHLCRWGRYMANDIYSIEDMEKGAPKYADKSPTEWNAESYAFVNLQEYLEGYKSSKNGDMLLMDEIEYSADKRRHMSNENKNLSQAWSILRYKNVGTIATLPTVSMLDSRLMELADIWINVIYPGYARIYYLTVDDFQHQIIFKRFRINGHPESIRWPKIPEDDEDFAYLKEDKKGMGVPGIDDTQNYDETDVKDAKKSVRENVTRELLATKGDVHNMTQTDIADHVDRSQQYVSKIKRAMRKEGVIE